MKDRLFQHSSLLITIAFKPKQHGATVMLRAGPEPKFVLPQENFAVNDPKASKPVLLCRRKAHSEQFQRNISLMCIVKPAVFDLPRLLFKMASSGVKINGPKRKFIALWGRDSF